MAHFQTPKVQVISLLAKKRQERYKKNTIIVYSCGKIHSVLHILIMFSLNILFHILHHQTIELKKPLNLKTHENK